MLVVALVAFVGVAAIVPGGIAGLEPAGSPGRAAAARRPRRCSPLPTRSSPASSATARRPSAAASVREALWAAADLRASAIAIGAAAIRAMGIPRLIGPALLMFLFYLWDSLHATPPTRRRDPRWIWETLVLVGLGAAVAFWNLRLVG